MQFCLYYSLTNISSVLLVHFIISLSDDFSHLHTVLWERCQCCFTIMMYTSPWCSEFRRKSIFLCNQYWAFHLLLADRCTRLTGDYDGRDIKVECILCVYPLPCKNTSLEIWITCRLYTSFRLLSQNLGQILLPWEAKPNSSSSLTKLIS